MKYKLKVYSIWEYGKRKDSEGNPHQEDCTFPLPEDLKDTDRTFILCDGMGGHDAGEVASATVCQAMGDYILHDGHDAEGVFTDEDLRNAIDAAFKALDKKDNGAEKKMGTTMTLLKLHNDGATIAHMGDSRVYHIRPGKDGEDTEFWATEDHSLVNDLIKIGELTKEEARTSKQKNVITRAMQPNMERRPKADVKHISDIKAGDFFYMCSDGMLEQEDMENGESIRNIFSNAIPSVEDKVKILTRVTEENRDNHTALIIHILEVENESNAEEKTSTAISSIDFGLVEGDEPAHISGSTSSESETPREDVSGNEEKAEKNEQNANMLSQTEAPRPIDKTSESNNSKSSKGKLNIGRWILRFFGSVIIVVVCILGYNYIQSCSEKKLKQQTELPQTNIKHETENKRKTKEKTKDHIESKSTPERQETPQEVALDDAHSVTAEGAVDENQVPPEDSNGNSTMAIPLPASDEAVNSDQEVINEILHR